LKSGQLPAFHLFLRAGEDSRVERLLAFEEMPEDARRFMSHRGDGFCGSTALGSWSMKVFMVSALSVIIVVWGASPTTCGSASRPAEGNPRLLRKADTFTRFIASHTD
jgi:hypothetical protein